jgi:outer membrane protein assembly factor BamB
MLPLRRIVLFAGLLLLSVAAVRAADTPAPAAERIPYLEREWAQPLSREEPARQWVRNQAVRYLEGRGQPVVPAFQPLAVGEKVLFRSHWGIHAVNLRTGKLEWESDSRWSIDRMMRDPAKAGSLAQWLATYANAGQPAVVLDNATLGTLTTDGQRVFAVEDLQVPPPGVPNPAPPPEPGSVVGASLRDAIYHSRLQAFDLRTGKLLWEVGGRALAASETGTGDAHEAGSDLKDSFFLAAPLVLNGKLYVLNEKANDLRLLCLDPARGELLWSQYLASVRVALYQDPQRRLRGAPLAYADGILVCPTGVGALLGIDLRTRTLLWAHTYSRPPQEPAPAQQAQLFLRRQPFPGMERVGFRWRGTPPLIQGDRIVYTPPDSPALFCLRLRDGSPVWETRAGQDDTYLAGLFPGAALIVGRRGSRALSLSDGRLLWELDTGLPSGRGVAEGGLFYLPLKAAAGTGEAGVAVLDVAKGRVAARNRSPGTDVPGNLLFHDGSVVSQTAEEVVAYPQARTSLDRIDRIVAREPHAPEALADRGGLRLSEGDVRGAITDLRAALANGATGTVRARARTALLDALTELLRQDFPAGEKYLDEYDRLCRPDLPATATPEKRQDAEAEARQRRAARLFLTGRGREGQGRALSTVQAYLDFLLLPEDGEMVPAAGDPALRVRRHVFAAGRVRALLEQAAPADRRSLTEEVAQRVKALEAENLPALERLIRVVGTSVVGPDACLALAQRLQQGNGFLEAERILLQLAEEAEGPATAARATEALARLEAQRGLLADAAARYRALGREYGKIQVRDGKTGADLLAEAALDKRFLPYLEVPGPVARRRMEVREKEGPHPSPPPSFTFEPAGDPPPFFRDQQFVLDLGSHQLRVLDALTGEEHWNLNLSRTSFPNHAAAGTPDRPVRVHYHTTGHLLVVGVGHMLFGIDALGRRLLWERNLFGSAGVPAEINAVFDPREGTLEVLYQDGWTQTLGQVSVLGTRAVCVLTRDGLLALDPYSGGLLWSRSDVGMRSRFFGDGDCLYVLGRDAQGVPTGSCVLRAADGSRVRAPDFTAFDGMRLNAPGRRLLLEDRGAEGQVLLRLHDVRTGRGVWRREFPAGSRVLRSEDPALTGVVDPQGAVTVIDLPSGHDIISARLDARRLTGVKQLHVLQDAALVYILGNSPPDPKTFPGGGPFADVQPGAGVPFLRVSGWVCAFDRATGKRTWEADVPNQVLLLERFADLPVLLFASSFQRVVAAGNFRAAVNGAAVRIIDKRTGKLLVDHPRMSNAAGPFHAIRVSPDAGTVRLLGANLRITVTAEE